MTREEVNALLATLARDPELKARMTALLSTPPAPVNGRFEALLEEIRDLRAAFQTEMKALRADFNTRMEALRQDFNTAMGEMAREVRDLRQHVGALGERYGFTLEELAADRLPRYLKAKEGWQVEWPLPREYQVGGRTIEVDLVAEARKARKRALLVAEVKSRVVAADVREFRAQLDRIPELEGTELLRAFCGHLIHPAAIEEGQRLDVRVLHLSGLA